MNDTNDLDPRTKIIQAALMEFSTKGKAGARMDAIAEQAGVNKAMLYYYFGNKDDLFQATLKNILEMLMAKQSRWAGAEADITQVLESVVDDLLHFFQERPEVLRLLAHEMLNDALDLRKVAQALAPAQPITEQTGLAQRLRAGIDNGEVRGKNPVHIGLNMFALCAFPILFLPLIKIMWNMNDLDDAGFMTERKKHIIELLRHGLFLPVTK